MTLRVALIPGDGIGSEVVAQAERVLRALVPGVRTTAFDFGANRYLQDGTTLPDSFVDEAPSQFDAILLGALGDPRVPDHVHAEDIVLGLRRRLDLFVNQRPVKLLHGRYGPLKHAAPSDVDFVVFRENTEGLYTGIGGQFKRGTVDEVAIEAEMNTYKGVERIIRAAFVYAVEHGRTNVCLADKSNALRHGHDLWQRVFRTVSDEFSMIEARHLYVDAAVMEMVRAPEQFDVIVTNNLFGDILTDLGAQLQGGMGLAASANTGLGTLGVFEPVHGSAPALAGRGVANPLAAILSVGMLLRFVGQADLDNRIERATRYVLSHGSVTPELGGTLTTSQAGDALLDALQLEPS